MNAVDETPCQLEMLEDSPWTYEIGRCIEHHDVVVIFTDHKVRCSIAAQVHEIAPMIDLFLEPTAMVPLDSPGFGVGVIPVDGGVLILSRDSDDREDDIYIVVPDYSRAAFVEMLMGAEARAKAQLHASGVVQ